MCQGLSGPQLVWFPFFGTGILVSSLVFVKDSKKIPLDSFHLSLKAGGFNRASLSRESGRALGVSHLPSVSCVPPFPACRSLWMGCADPEGWAEVKKARMAIEIDFV